MKYEQFGGIKQEGTSILYALLFLFLCIVLYTLRLDLKCSST